MSNGGKGPNAFAALLSPCFRLWKASGNEREHPLNSRLGLCCHPLLSGWIGSKPLLIRSNFHANTAPLCAKPHLNRVSRPSASNILTAWGYEALFPSCEWRFVCNDTSLGILRHPNGTLGEVAAILGLGMQLALPTLGGRLPLISRTFLAGVTGDSSGLATPQTAPAEICSRRAREEGKEGRGLLLPPFRGKT